MTKDPKTCIFCGGDPLTREHIFPWWVRRAVGGQGRAHHAMSAGEQYWLEHGCAPRYTRQWEDDELELTVRCVCEPCNNTWMNRLDEDAERHVTALASTEPLAIADAELAVVAAWATKVAMLLEHTRSPSALTRRRAFVPSSQHAELFRTREPPTAASLWVARVAPPWPGVWWRTAPLSLTFVAPAAAAGYGSPTASLITFAFGAVAFQALFAPPVDFFRNEAARRTEDGAEFMRRLWPEQLLRWPPPKALRLEALEKFAQ